MFATSPIAYTPGAPATVRSGWTSIRPPRPRGRPPVAATAGAWIPPPHTTQRVRIVDPSASETWPGPTSVTATPRCSRTPLRPRILAA